MQFPIIQANKDLQQAVSARELYAFLAPTERFASWFDRQLQYGFVDGQDYLGCEFFNTLANQRLADFFISVDMAKEISMIQRSDKGRQARQYFIECERKATQSSPVMPALPDFTNPALAARAWADEYQAKQLAQEQLALAAPKVAHYDAVVERSTLLNATQVAHSVGLSSPQRLNKQLEALGVYNGNCKRGKEFRAWFLDKGLGEMKQSSTGHQQPLFTTKGQAWIFEKLASSEVA